MLFKKSIALGLSALCSVLIYAQNKPYKAGEVYTENIYQYGKMEVRMLAATGSGIISNFFTFKEGSELASTFWEEIDIEVFGKDGANSWQTNLITGQGNSNLTRTEGVHQNNGLGQEYHTYTIEWKPDSVTWLIDGVVTRQINGGQSLLIDDETSLRFNIWNPNIPEWVGPFNQASLPVHMYVNWIKFYEWNGNSFENTPSLEDNFTSFDASTWTKANHTFNENLSDFIPENVNVVDGYLVLSITNDDETGYFDTPPVDEEEEETTIILSPIAEFTTNVVSGTAPLTVTFDASASVDPNGLELDYTWNFGDGSSSNNEIINHTFENPGNYTVTLVIANSEGETDITTTVIDVEEEEGETNSGNCTFNTPTSTPLPTHNKAYTNVFVIGEDGPNLSNITNFTINWDLQNNGLWQMSFNTNNGNPSWWMDLRNNASTNFSSSEPQITFENSGINGLDGSYFVNIINEDFVMVSATEDFTIYFSASEQGPDCDNTNTSLKSINQNTNITIFPNPSRSSFNLSPSENISRIEIFDITGKLIESVANQNLPTVNFGRDLLTGVYFLRAYDNNSFLIKTSKLVKK